MLQPMHMTATPAGTACSGTFIRALLPPGTDWWGSVQMGVLPACAGRHSAAQPTWGKSKHCTVFVIGSSSQHGETQYYYCCSIQNTDTHDLWTKLSQVTPVLYSRRWGMNNCPHLKTGKKANPLYKLLYIFPTYCLPPRGCPADSRWQCALLVSLVYKQECCVAPDIWVEASYTYPYISIDTGPYVRHPGTRNRI